MVNLLSSAFVMIRSSSWERLWRIATLFVVSLRHCQVAVEISRRIDVEADNIPGGIDGESIGESRVERWASGDVNGNRGIRAPALQESVLSCRWRRHIVQRNLPPN